MLSTKKALVTELKKVCDNVYFELDVQSPTFPCITYLTVNDSVNRYGDNLGYSDVTYQIKVWSTKVSELADIARDIDKKLRSIGLKRSYYSEMTANEVIISVMRYSGLVKEDLD